MSRWLVAGGLLVAAAVSVFWLGVMPPKGPARIAPEAGGGCGCPKYYHCCLDCNGNVLCVRSISQCPECPAP
jgi:hypothetical protein